MHDFCNNSCSSQNYNILNRFYCQKNIVCFTVIPIRQYGSILLNNTVGWHSVLHLCYEMYKFKNYSANCKIQIYKLVLLFDLFVKNKTLIKQQLTKLFF